MSNREKKTKELRKHMIELAREEFNKLLEKI